MRAIENILFHEWIGLKIKISESSQTSLKNISGKIIFETKNMLIVRTLNNGIKKIPKKIILQSILYLPSTVCFIKGNQLIGRPEDRVLKIKR
ncbi:MAG TPA: ribonuclease P protein subunit [Nitrososphaeraceae archaeon]|nr:ribonuclease P protein subunit [Nitrososphaeraceae archaeon]